MTVEAPFMSENAPGDARQLVGKRDGKLVLVHALGCPFKPRPEAELLPVVGPHEDDLGGLHEQGTQIPVAAL